MKPHLLFLGAAGMLIVACTDMSSPKKDGPETDTPAEMPPAKVTDGRYVISALPKISEPNACVLPITITNGTDKPATISMMQFTVKGPGEEDSGNMFGQTVAPGATNIASLLFPTRACSDLMEIVSPVLKCTTEGQDCTERLELKSTDTLSFHTG